MTGIENFCFSRFLLWFYFQNLLSGQIFTYFFYENFVTFPRKPGFRRGQKSWSFSLIEYSLKGKIQYQLFIFSFMLPWTTIVTYTRFCFKFIYLTIYKIYFEKSRFSELFSQQLVSFFYCGVRSYKTFGNVSSLYLYTK